MRIAFFGGTFDPIHQGHLRIAAAAADVFDLDRVLFAPAGEQPLKPEGTSASFADRLAMVQVAIAGHEQRFAASSIDAPRADGAPNYTVDTLAILAAEYRASTLFVLVGADSFLDLRRWRSPDRLLSLAEWIVVSRPDVPLAAKELEKLALTATQQARVHLLANVFEDISATGLRQRLAAGLPCGSLLPPGVEAYIEAHHLYRQVSWGTVGDR